MLAMISNPYREETPITALEVLKSVATMPPYKVIRCRKIAKYGTRVTATEVFTNDHKVDERLLDSTQKHY
jgi:hypothetical protein